MTALNKLVCGDGLYVTCDDVSRAMFSLLIDVSGPSLPYVVLFLDLGCKIKLSQ